MSLYTKAERNAPAHERREGLRRHSRNTPCPVCNGHPGLPQGRGVRCAGFTLDLVTYCTREEHAGALPLDITTSPPAYRHRLYGRCDCGAEHGWSSVGEPIPQQRTRLKTPPLAQRHAVYKQVLNLLELGPSALADLTRCGLTVEAAGMAGYRSLPRRGGEHRGFLQEMVARFGEETLRRCPGFLDKNGRLGFWTAWAGHDGYIVPYRDEEGRISGMQAKYLNGPPFDSSRHPSR